MPKRYASVWDRIVANSAVDHEQVYDGVPCRLWLGHVTQNRGGVFYGRISRRLKRGPRKGRPISELVHRVVVRDVKGLRLTRRMVVMHLCNNSTCVEPAHLIGGRQKRNVRQCVEEGRHGNAYRAPVRDMRKAA